MSYRNTYKDCLAYIHSYWDRITKTQKEDDQKTRTIGLPRPFLVPNTDRFPYLFYWDSYFMILGILGTPRQNLALNIIENFIFLFKKFNIIPNLASYDFIHRSQPPLFSSMIMDTYKYTRDKAWLKISIEVAKNEYKTVWTNEDDVKNASLMGNFHHKIKDHFLSRYGDRDTGYPIHAELESGWDFTSRFYGRCSDFLAIDLNCFLYKYETDFIESAKILKRKKEELFWKTISQKRKSEITKYMWSRDEQFFYDFDYTHKIQSPFVSLAGFLPMWAGLATQKQAEGMKKKLPLFETEYGLTVTDASSLAPLIDVESIPNGFRQTIKSFLSPKQWDYPNIWPPLEYLTVIGFLRYGFLNDARRIMEKSVRTHAWLFRKYGTMYEKIDGVTGDKPLDYQYPNQTGFGWTNAVFYRYIQLLDSMDYN